MSDLKYTIEEAAELLYARNKWAMLCNHFGYNQAESCAATFIDRIEKAEAEVHTRTPEGETSEDFLPRVEYLDSRVALLEAKNKSLGTWNKEQGDALSAIRQELTMAYDELKRRDSMIDLIYVDADGETPNPETWKQRAENLESLLSIRDNEVKMLKMELESVIKLIPHPYNPCPPIGSCSICGSDDRNDGKHLEEK